ncbi:hypothetical protein [Marinobacter sp.]|uniref:hypothetical protein n=1 Tax=Marinobacter sp. TaxID=50741 RepID=UPI00257FD6E9|nr:hypothetical protein [Marinobacter sp.]
MMKSPLPAHGKLEKQLEILKNDPELAVKKGLSTEGQGGKDYEAIAALEKKIKEAKAKHSSERRESDSAQIREDEDASRGSAAEMSPFEQGGYVGGGMSKSDYAPVGDLYQDMFNKISGAADKVIKANVDYCDDDENKGTKYYDEKC